MPAAGVVLIVAVVLIVLALVYYLVVDDRRAAPDHGRARRDDRRRRRDRREERAGQRRRRRRSTQNLDAAVDALEGLLVKKAGMEDAVGLVEGLYPGAAAAGLRNFPDSRDVKAPRIAEVYTKGTLTLARLGREAPIAAASPSGPVLRNVTGGSLAARSLYPEVRQSRPEKLPRSPVIGADSPVQYEPSPEPGRRRRFTPRERTQGADPSTVRLRARDERRGRDRGAQPARPGRADHRRRAQPAADDEAAARVARAPGRHQRPRRPRLHPRGGRRGRDRGADPARRPARVRAARPAAAGVPRRRAGDRRPGRAQPRHDRRVAVPGRRRRGPVGGLRGAEGAPDDPRRRRLADRADRRVPPRAVDDRGRQTARC